MVVLRLEQARASGASGRADEPIAGLRASSHNGCAKQASPIYFERRDESTIDYRRTPRCWWTDIRRTAAAGSIATPIAAASPWLLAPCRARPRRRPRPRLPAAHSETGLNSRNPAYHSLCIKHVKVKTGCVRCGLGPATSPDDAL